MIFRWLADLTALTHLAFVVFVLVGGLIVARRPHVAWAHVPSVVWAVVIEWTGGVCPLTPVENWLRRRAGDAGFQGGFVEHYLLPLLYPAGLTRGVQLALGAIVLFVNVVAYAMLVRAARKRRGRRRRSSPNGGKGR